jgi:hypothetical protein
VTTPEVRDITRIGAAASRSFAVCGICNSVGHLLAMGTTPLASRLGNLRTAMREAAEIAILDRWHGC